MKDGPTPAIHGVVRWRLIDLAQWVFEEFRVSISKQTLSRELRAMGFRKRRILKMKLANCGCWWLGSAALLIVDSHLRCSFAHFELCAHLPNLRCLHFNAGREGLNFLLLPRDGRFQLLDLAVLFEELVK